jgi:hypothetical protein
VEGNDIEPDSEIAPSCQRTSTSPSLSSHISIYKTSVQLPLPLECGSKLATPDSQLRNAMIAARERAMRYEEHTLSEPRTIVLF